MNLHRKAAKNIPLIIQKLFIITRKTIKIIEFWLLHRDFNGFIGKISNQLFLSSSYTCIWTEKLGKIFPCILQNYLKFKRTRKCIKTIDFWLYHEDFQGTIGEISYQLIPLITLHINLQRKPAKNIPLIFQKLIKITIKRIKIIEFWLLHMNFGDPFRKFHIT